MLYWVAVKEIILTGLRANGELHLGNYLGAIMPVVDLQRRFKGDYQVNLFVADMHSITTPVDFSDLPVNIKANLATYVAAGLDLAAADTHVYRQSRIGCHGELAWYLSCFTGYGEAQRMTEFKDKSSQVDTVTAGLFNYPILMAADILLYGAQWVPVGEDQRQHLELCREVAQRMNNRFAEVYPEGLFVVPHETAKQMAFCDRDQAPRVRSLRHPGKKMSKSISDPSGTILLSDPPAEAARKVMRAETDSIGAINDDFAAQPGISNLLQMLSLLSARSHSDVVGEWQGKTVYGELKKAVAERVEQFLTDFQARLASVDEVALAEQLEAHEAAMRQVALARLERIQAAVGLRG